MPSVFKCTKCKNEVHTVAPETIATGVCGYCRFEKDSKSYERARVQMKKQ